MRYIITIIAALIVGNAVGQIDTIKDSESKLRAEFNDYKRKSGISIDTCSLFIDHNNLKELKRELPQDILKKLNLQANKYYNLFYIYSKLRKNEVSKNDWEKYLQIVTHNSKLGTKAQLIKEQTDFYMEAIDGIEEIFLSETYDYSLEKINESLIPDNIKTLYNSYILFYLYDKDAVYNKNNKDICMVHNGEIVRAYELFNLVYRNHKDIITLSVEQRMQAICTLNLGFEHKFEFSNFTKLPPPSKDITGYYKATIKINGEEIEMYSTLRNEDFYTTTFSQFGYGNLRFKN